MGQSNANPFAVFDIATHIKECVLVWLETTSKGLPERACVISGELAWDNCECGQLTVAIQNEYESSGTTVPRAGTETPGRRSCGPPLYVANFMVTMLRCAPTGKNTEPPTCDELEAFARAATEDAWAVRAGVICCLDEAISTRLPNGTKLYRDFVVGTQTRVGPQGACGGSQLPVAVTIDNGCYPCEQVS
jgi:hypothetical protein